MSFYDTPAGIRGANLPDFDLFVLHLASEHGDGVSLLLGISFVSQPREIERIWRTAEPWGTGGLASSLLTERRASGSSCFRNLMGIDLGGTPDVAVPFGKAIRIGFARILFFICSSHTFRSSLNCHSSGGELSHHAATTRTKCSAHGVADLSPFSFSLCTSGEAAITHITRSLLVSPQGNTRQAYFLFGLGLGVLGGS